MSGKFYIFLFSLALLALPPIALSAVPPQCNDDIARISLSELLELSAQEPVVIVDARVPRAWNRAGNKIPEAIRLDTPEEIADFVATTDRQQAIVLYCLCPQERSSAGQALNLSQQGFSRIWVLEGGYFSWISEDLPLDDK